MEYGIVYLLTNRTKNGTTESNCKHNSVLKKSQQNLQRKTIRISIKRYSNKRIIID